MKCLLDIIKLLYAFHCTSDYTDSDEADNDTAPPPPQTTPTTPTIAAAATTLMMIQPHHHAERLSLTPDNCDSDETVTIQPTAATYDSHDNRQLRQRRC
jgi:hypothetical protein